MTRLLVTVRVSPDRVVWACTPNAELLTVRLLLR
jgi:hypothetical protein